MTRFLEWWKPDAGECPPDRKRLITLTPARSSRIAIAMFFGVLAAAIAARAQFFAHGNGGDHLVLWRAARLMLAGGDPYAQQPNKALLFYYPMPAAALGLPFAWANVQWAAVLFVGVSAAFLGYVLTHDGYHRVPVALSATFFVAAQFAQTSIAILALGLAGPIAGLSILKPNIALALFAWRPTRAFVVGTGVVLIASLVVSPTWPVRWFVIVRHSPTHHSPLLVPGGPLCLLAILRWRRPEARLLLAMTLVPHGLYFYDELPLWLVAQTRREAMLLTLTSWMGWFGWIAVAPTAHPGIADMAPWVIAMIYLPALVIVLRHPNTAAGAVDGERNIPAESEVTECTVSSSSSE